MFNAPSNCKIEEEGTKKKRKIIIDLQQQQKCCQMQLINKYELLSRHETRI